MVCKNSRSCRCGLCQRYFERLDAMIRRKQEASAPTLAEACEVIEALLGIPDMECPHCGGGGNACEVHAEADAFLERVKSTARR